MKYFVLFFILFSINIFSQVFSVNGIVKDSSENVPLSGANVALIPGNPSRQAQYTSTNSKGFFEFNNVPVGRYNIEISFIGFETYKDTVRVRQRDTMLPTILLKGGVVKLDQVEVTGLAIAADQKEDTVSFNAKAFKVSPDANAEDLVTKIPGITREGGVIKAQGEEVRQVLVDGKPFFGEDPNIALRNLPAELIEKIQIFDKLSDQSQFTGFDDGSASKTINIVTRGDRRIGQFGKLYGGYGTDDRFLSGGNVNLFDSQRRISIIGLGNNVNQQNFSSQDLIGLVGASSGGQGGGRGRGHGGGGSSGGTGFRPGGDVNNFLVGAQDGNTNTYSLGINYMNSWGEDLKITGSYFFNLSNVSNNQILKREYFAEPLNGQLYDETSFNTSDNYNHRVNARIEYTIDSSNSFIITPRLFVQKNDAGNAVLGFNALASGAPISSTDYNYKSNSTAINFSNELLYRLKFDLPMRTLSASINTSFNTKDSPYDLLSENIYYQRIPTDIDTINQSTEQYGKGYTLSSNINYTEPVGENGQIQLNVVGSFTKNTSDKKTNNLNNTTGFVNSLDTLLSNEFDNDFIRFNPGISYRYRKDDFNFTSGISYQQSTLIGNQLFPKLSYLEKTFGDILLSSRISFNFTETSNIRFHYNTNINAPSISQLQNTIDNSNPLFLRAGNSSLDAEYSHRMFVRYMSTDKASGSNLFTMVFANYATDYIGTKTISAIKDTLLENGIFLNKGSQLSIPMNFDYSLSRRAMINYGFPIPFLKSNLNFSTYYNYSSVPSQINDSRSFTYTNGMGTGLILSSNISEKIDFKFSYSPTLNFSKNDLQKNLDNDYIVHTASGSVNWIFYEDFFIKNDFAYYNNTGLSADINRSFYLWNVGFGTYLFSDRTGMLRLDVFDILNQNESLNKVISETYIEDKSNKVLKQYFLLSFTYNLRMFGR